MTAQLTRRSRREAMRRPNRLALAARWGLARVRGAWKAVLALVGTAASVAADRVLRDGVEALNWSTARDAALFGVLTAVLVWLKANAGGAGGVSPRA